MPFKYQCPECKSRNTTEKDDEGLVDCLGCGIWFNPKHPRNWTCYNGLLAQFNKWLKTKLCKPKTS